MEWSGSPAALLTALGIGLLIGVVREHREEREDRGPIMAGVRTHALVAILAAVAMGFGVWAWLTVLALVGGLAIASYLHTGDEDPGLTSEIGLLVTAGLAGLTLAEPAIASALGVVAASLVYAKRPLQRLAREVISPRELKDALLLAASALVILPFLPDTPVDPWGVLVPQTVWRLVVLVMAVGMLGHIAVRLIGGRLGLLVAGFFAGFASSTAAVASFGQRARESAAMQPASVSAALLANLASLLLLAAVLVASSPSLMRGMAWPLAAAAVVLLGAGLLAWRRGSRETDMPDESNTRAVNPWHALLFAAVISGVLLLSTGLQHLFGDAGAIAGAMLAALAELQASAASIAQLSAADGLTPEHARWGIVGILASSSIAKSVLAFAAGGVRYGVGVCLGLLVAVAAAAAVTAAT